jgi:hypothetical protein
LAANLTKQKPFGKPKWPQLNRNSGNSIFGLHKLPDIPDIYGRDMAAVGEHFS